VQCRIHIRREQDHLVVRLAGRLAEAQVPDLLEACAGSRDTREPTIVELDELVSADPVGMDALLRVERQGARLVGLPEYIRLKLNVLGREPGR
jgi:hypothetical protein